MLNNAVDRPIRCRVAILLLFAAAAAQYAWNAYWVEPLTGYDAGGHAGYVLTLVKEHRLPNPGDPAQGWSHFHPPLYYVVGGVVWTLLEPIGPRVLVMGLRAIGALACLAAAGAAYRLVMRFGVSHAVAWVTTALVLFVPVVQMSSSMIGNEALAYGLGALALPPLLRLQRDPRDVSAAMLASLFAGMAFITKFTGAFVLAACIVPFLRTDLDRGMVRALAAALLIGVVVAGPVYVRNLIVAGTPFPMSRVHEPMKSTEAAQILRPRRLTDYLWLDPECLRRPSLYHVGSEPPADTDRNRAMTNVWGLAYSTIWYDGFAQRIPLRFHRDGVVAGPLLALLGLLPTGTMWLGFAGALLRTVRTRGRCDEAPLVASWIVGLAVFISFTWQAPSAVAVKGSYLLPLAVPGAVFFANGASWLGARLRAAVLVVAGTAAMASALVFTTWAVFPPQPKNRMVLNWKMVGGLIPGSNIGEAVDRLIADRDWKPPSPLSSPSASPSASPSEIEDEKAER